MKTCNRQYEALLPDIVRQQLGERPGRLRPVPTYPDSIVYEVELSSGTFLFKAMDPAGVDPAGIALEAWACERARQAGVPAPEVLAVDTSRRLFPGSYFIMRRAEGCPLSELHLSREEERPYIYQLGHYLRQLHAVHLDGFGWLDESAYFQTGAVRGIRPTWRAFLLDNIETNLEQLVAAGAMEAQRMEIVWRLLQQYDELLDYPAPGSLLHGDLGSLHVWVDVGRQTISCIVDFGERKAGDPIWDLVEYDWKAREMLIAGYEVDAAQRAEFDRRYYLYAVLRAIPWARRWYALGGAQISSWLNFTIESAEEQLG